MPPHRSMRRQAQLVACSVLWLIGNCLLNQTFGVVSSSLVIIFELVLTQVFVCKYRREISTRRFYTCCSAQYPVPGGRTLCVHPYHSAELYRGVWLVHIHTQPTPTYVCSSAYTRSHRMDLMFDTLTHDLTDSNTPRNIFIP